MSSARDLYPDSLFTAAPQQWNGISSQLNISNSVVFSDTYYNNTDIHIEAGNIGSSHFYGHHTTEFRNGKRVSVITLTNAPNTVPNINKTLTHEVGHALGFEDITPGDCYRDYRSIMVQTHGYNESSVITAHDEYSVILEWGQ